MHRIVRTSSLRCQLFGRVRHFKERYFALTVHVALYLKWISREAITEYRATLYCSSYLCRTLYVCCTDYCMWTRLRSLGTETFLLQVTFHSSRVQLTVVLESAKFQNTRPLLCISLNNKSAYFVVPCSLKCSDNCKWCGQVFWIASFNL